MFVRKITKPKLTLSKMTEAYEIDEAFKQLIIECGRALNTLELVILNLRFPLLQYFETLSIYKLPKVENFYGIYFEKSSISC